jgi:hypothetical protein
MASQTFPGLSGALIVAVAAFAGGAAVSAENPLVLSATDVQ